jgi:cytidine deaminase
MGFEPIDRQDEELVAAAQDVLSRNYRPERHTVGSALLAGSGAVYTGVNVEACGYGPCAEPVAVGAAFSSGEREIRTIVAVCQRGDDYPVIPPCGNCRQLVFDYSPDAKVILEVDGELVKATVRDLLPAAFQTWPDDNS